MSDVSFKIDRTVNIGVLFGMLMQVAFVVWWSATIDIRVTALEALSTDNKAKFREIEIVSAKEVDRLTRLEEQMKIQTSLMERIYRIIDNKFGK